MVAAKDGFQVETDGEQESEQLMMCSRESSASQSRSYRLSDSFKTKTMKSLFLEEH